MVAFLTVLLILIFIVVLNATKSTKGKRQSSLNTHKTNYTLDDIKQSRARYDSQEEKDDRFKLLYSDYYQKHSRMGLEEISEYIEQKREEDDYYWGRNRIEYKVLMDISRKLHHERLESFRKRIESELPQDIPVHEALDMIHELKLKKHAVDDFCVKKFMEYIDNALIERYEIELKSYSKIRKVIWVNARINEGVYIPLQYKEMVEHEADFEKNNSIEYLKRERKNIQNKISKYKQSGDTDKVEAYIQRLEENTNKIKGFK